MRSTRVAVSLVAAGLLVAVGWLGALRICRSVPPVPPEPTRTVSTPDVPRCSGWLPVVPSSMQMIDVVRVGDDDAWLLTTRGVFRWDSCAWRLQPSLEIAWVLGDWGVILHWNGTQWAEVSAPALTSFRGAAIDAGELWVGDGDSIYRHVGPFSP